ncbi:MAG: hypothetical protein QMB62_00935, partial [Oscillospiraceae bacterium]
DELICLWRCIKKLGGFLELQYGDCSRRNAPDFSDPVKLCLGIRILNELKLLDVRKANGRALCSVSDNGEKTELSASPLFRLLWS